jgi:hypothetical protein
VVPVAFSRPSDVRDLDHARALRLWACRHHKARQDAADRLVELQGMPRADGWAAQTGPARLLATILGTDAETVIRWLVVLLVLLIDPSAVVLTIAAARAAAQPAWGRLATARRLTRPLARRST